MLLGSDDWTINHSLEALSSADTCFLLLVLMIWIAALMAQMPMPRVLVWLWWAAVLVISWVRHFVTFLTLQADLPLEYPRIGYQDVDPVVKALMWIIGLGILGGAVFLLAARRRSGMLLAVVLTIIGLMNAFSLGASSHLQSTHHAARLLIDSALTHLYSLAVWHPVIWIEFRTIDGTQVILANLLSYTRETSCSPWLFWLPWVFQAAIVYGYYKLIEWLVVNGVARRKRSGAVS